MVQYTSTRTFESKAVPGVTIDLKKTNEKRRAELMRELAPFTDEQRKIAQRFADLQNRMVLVTNEDGTPKMNVETAEQEKEFTTEDLPAALDILQELDEFKTLKVKPIYVRWGVARINGLEIDGRAATVDDLLGEDAPDGLLDEVFAAIEGKIELPVEKKSELLSDFTSLEAHP